MKQTAIKILSLLLCLFCIFTCLALVSCKGNEEPQNTTEPAQSTALDPLWSDATYTADKTFGNGAKTIKVEVIAGETSVTFTVKTDKSTLADALLEHELIAGDMSTYGLYVKTVNGILADWDVDQTYWGVGIEGKAASTGASDIKIKDGEHYEFTRKK